MTFPRRLEPLTQRVRARIGKRIILDTTHAQLLFEDERHPHHRVDALPSGRHVQVLVNGEPLAATGYLLEVEPDTTGEGAMEEGRHD